MSVKKSEYGSQSISALKGADRVRKRPAVIFGSDGLEGCEHSFFEILSNSIDESREGYGKLINVTVTDDRVITVEDHGRGVPLGWNEKEQRYNWELVYCEMYAGGKYEKNGSSAYGYSLGTNGLGACATQYASEFMTVVSCSNGIRSKMEFERGNPVGDLVTEPCARGLTGTTVRWKPDYSVFTDISIPYEFFADTMHKQAVVNAGLTLVLNFQGEDGEWRRDEFLYPNGIVDYINEQVGVNYLTEPVDFSCERRGRDRADQDDYDLLISFAFCFSNEVNLIEYYHNSSFLEYGGSPEKAAKSAFVYAIDKYLRDSGKYTKNEAKISWSDVEDSLVLVTNCFSTETSYANQTKKSINNVFIADAMTDFFKHCLEVYFAENPAAADRACQQVLVNKRSRESAESMRLNVKKKLTSSLDINNNVEKFVNCRSKDPDLCELYIVEGDSALTSCKLARDSSFQAIIPVRGKTLNCLKASYDSIFKSDIILDLLKVIGCGVEIKAKPGKNLTAFSLDSLRWSKIIICTDADEDGYQIRTLILTMFYRLLPTLIREGRLYIAETPLYEITVKDETYFAYNEAEKAEVLGRIGSAKYTIQRSKGLGENDPDMMSRTTMHPATRRLVRVSPDDEIKTYEMFDVLLGDNLQGRKRFIAENGAKYLDLADY